MAAGGSSSGVDPHLPDMRIVLLGNRDAGKSSAGNIILGREEFDPAVRTVQCVKRQGEVAGRRVTVVDTPGWKDYEPCLYKDSPKVLQQEIVLSVTLCPPGPHAFLLVIHENMTFTEAERNATSNHLSLLGHGAWKHSLVLFIQETPVEEKDFEVKGKMLQWLVEKCGNRYHVLNTKKKEDVQVRELLEKIGKMVDGNNRLYYEINRDRLQEVEETRGEEVKRAEERRKKKQNQKHSFGTVKGDLLLSEVRIVLLGFKGAGKSSSGNTILGREEFRSGQRSAVCVKRQGEVAGRQVTVVEAPGWWADWPLQYNPKMVKREIVLSLCDQGPHSFCFVIRVDAGFTEQRKISLQQHLSLLGERVWSHTMVLFTHGDWLGYTTIEQYIESEGEHLKWLIEKCGNRYHVLNNKSKGDTTQTTQLLEKIEKMVTGNGSIDFTTSGANVVDLQEQMKTETKNAEMRMMKVKKQRDDLRSLGQIHQSSMRIVLLGFKQSGKSSTGNTILGRDVFELCSKLKCEKRQGGVEGRQVTMVTTPSWWWRDGTTNAHKFLQQETVLSVSLCPPGPHAFLLLIRVDVSFTSQYRQEVQQYLALFSGAIWSHTIVLFTCGDWLGDTTIEQHIESEGEDLIWLIEKCGNRYHVLNNLNRTDDTQVAKLLEKIEEMIAGNRGLHYEMDRNRLEETQERRRKEAERAKERLMKVEKQRQHLQSLKRELSPLSEFRVVLLGYKQSGKSSSGNTILGREEFDLKRRTAQCVKRQGEVAGRLVAVVDTPGWWYNVNLKSTSEITKQELVISVSLCPPGPHIFLLLIRVAGTLTKDDMRNIQEHMELVSERVWSHTMVLFTYGDWLGDTTIEQYIESEGALQSLVDKCGNRYHVINNMNNTDDQVMMLLEKIEGIVAGNRGLHYEVDRKRLEETQERRRKEEERAKERLMKVEKQRQHLQSLKQESSPLSEFRVVLLGYRQSGKSSSGNTILGRVEFDLNRRTAQCVKRQGEVAGRLVTVVDTPGWWKDFNLKSTPELTKQEIVLSVSLCPPGPHVLLLVIHVADSFTSDELRNVQEQLELVSERVWNHTMVLFTYGDWLGDTTIEQHIESEGALQSLVDKCGNRYHVVNNMNNTDDQVMMLLEKIEEIVAGNRGLHYEMDRKRLEEMEERGEKQRQRAEDRQMCVYKQRATLKYSVGDIPHLSDIRIVLLGFKGAGKSSSGNTILGREEFRSGQNSAVCVKRQGEVAGRQVTVVKAPGWFKDKNIRNTSQKTKEEIALSVSHCAPGPHALLLVNRTDYSFTEHDKQTFQDHLELLGKNIWLHTMVLFTCGDWLGDTTIEQHIESEGDPLRWVIEKCGKIYHVLNNKNRSDDTQVKELLEKIEEMVLRNRGGYYEMRQGQRTRMSFFRGLIKSIRGDKQKMETDEAASQLAGLDLKSMETPPMMSGDDRSEIFTVESSGYGTSTSVAPSEAPSEWGSMESINTVSSGIGSVSSGTLRGSRKPERSELRRRPAQSQTFQSTNQ